MECINHVDACSVTDTALHIGIFWWGFYNNASLDRFLDALLGYVAGRVDPEIKTAWQKADEIKKQIIGKEYLIILDGLEEMQVQLKGERLGCMKNSEFTDLLKFLVDAQFKGLCLITTRTPIKDLENYQASTYRETWIENLSIEDGLELLDKIGVVGTEEEKKKLIKEYEGHSLSITLLAKHLTKDFEGDIKEAEKIPPIYKEEAGGKAHRILVWYDRALTDDQRTFMRIFSIFRGRIGDEGFNKVFRKEMALSEFSFKELVRDLADRRLIQKSQDTYSTHPLIKGYFESTFDEKDKKLCHKRIYQYFGEIAPERPETLEEMQPLFEQVYHGCSAGMYDEVYRDVYREKIYRMEERFITHKLGAWETNLSLVKMFFPNSDLSKMPLVSKKDAQSFLFNEAGLALLNTGRPKEAEEPFLTGVKMTIEAKDWKNASMGYQNLADLQFRTGRLKESLETVKEALKMTEEAKFDKYIVYSKAYLAWIFYLLGKTKEAENCFREADELEKKISGDRLYSLRRVQYADFLISINRTDEALELTQKNLEICQRYTQPADISRCHRALSAIKRIKGTHKEASAHLQKALELTRKVGMPELEIEALLESGRLHLDTKRYDNAIKEAENVLKLCSRTGFKLYEPDAELILAKAYLSVECSVHDTACIDTVDALQNKAKSLAQSAYDKADLMGYHLPKLEAIELANKFKE